MPCSNTAGNAIIFSENVMIGKFVGFERMNSIHKVQNVALITVHSNQGIFSNFVLRKPDLLLCDISGLAKIQLRLFRSIPEIWYFIEKKIKNIK